MRLYLASFRTAECFAELAALAGAGARTAVISNAVDFIPADARAAYARNVYDPVAHFAELGLAAFDLDLRGYFGRPEALAAALQGVGLVWATGGNAFLLRRAMRQSGFDELIRAALAADRLVYGGWSAGAVVAGPDLHGLELMDDPATLAEGYEAEVCWEGLRLIGTAIVPHYRSVHPEAEAAEACVGYMQAHGLPHVALRDGEALVMDGGPLELRGLAGA